MHRRFAQHLIRRPIDLAGFWDFAFLGGREPDEVQPEAIAFDDVMAVPGSWDATPRYAGRRGLAAYRRTVSIDQPGDARLILDGLHHWARIYVDGEARLDHVGGFTQVPVDLPDLEIGSHEIVVLTDNRIDYDRCPLHLDYFDWYHFGGLTRGAELHPLGPFSIDDLRITTLDHATRRVKVAIHLRATEPTEEVDLTLLVNDAAQLNETVTLDAGESVIERELELKDLPLWSPDAPHLHLFRAEVHHADHLDDLQMRTGLRTVSLDGQAIQINGEPVQLRGFCRHESHPQFGCGLPDALIVADVQQLRDMNCNFVRGAHYPQDVRFLDLCDEAGLCVWNEAVAWQPYVEHLNDPKFIAAQKQNVEEMVAASYNSPAVMMLGIFNEGHSHKDGSQSGYETMMQHLRDVDGTRPITYACNHPFDDLNLHLCDIIAINTYPGWYGSEYTEIPQRLDDIVKHLDGDGHAEKPMIISEIGAGAIPGWRDWNETHWSEQYQSKALATTIRHMFFDRERFCGLSIWQFGDMRTGNNIEKRLGRPRGFNNKGVVDEYRRPKLAYQTVKELFGTLRRG